MGGTGGGYRVGTGWYGWWVLARIPIPCRVGMPGRPPPPSPYPGVPTYPLPPPVPHPPPPAPPHRTPPTPLVLPAGYTTPADAAQHATRLTFGFSAASNHSARITCTEVPVWPGRMARSGSRFWTPVLAKTPL